MYAPPSGHSHFRFILTRVKIAIHSIVNGDRCTRFECLQNTVTNRVRFIDRMIPLSATWRYPAAISIYRLRQQKSLKIRHGTSTGYWVLPFDDKALRATYRSLVRPIAELKLVCRLYLGLNKDRLSKTEKRSLDLRTKLLKTT